MMENWWREFDKQYQGEVYVLGSLPSIIKTIECLQFETQNQLHASPSVYLPHCYPVCSLTQVPTSLHHTTPTKMQTDRFLTPLHLPPQQLTHTIRPLCTLLCMLVWPSPISPHHTPTHTHIHTPTHTYTHPPTRTPTRTHPHTPTHTYTPTHTSTPLTSSLFRSPAIIRMKVVLPVPFSPNITTISESVKAPPYV